MQTMPSKSTFPWARALSLLAALSGVRLALLLSARGHLFREHWRYTPPPPGAAGRVILLLIVFSLLAVSLLAARHARRREPVQVHLLTFILLLFGLLFHCSSTVAFERNYLHSLAIGAITFKDLRAYLLIESVDRQPYLAVFLAILAAGWAAAARARRHHWLPPLAGMLAGSYLVVRFWTAPPPSDQQLTVLACAVLGALMTVPALRRKSPPGAAAVNPFPAAPVVSVACLGLLAALVLAFALWHGTSVLQRFPVLLIPHLAATAALAALIWLLLARQSNRQLSPFLPFIAALYFFFANAGYPLSDNFANLAVHTLCLGGYWGGELAVVLLAGLAGMLAGRLNRRLGAIGFDILAVLLMVLACLDVMVYRLLDIRLGWTLLAMGDDLRLIWGVVGEFVTVRRALVLALPVALYFPLYRFLRAKSPAFTPLIHARGRLLILLSGVCWMGGLLQPRDKISRQATWELVQSSPLCQRFKAPRLSRDELRREGRSLGILPAPATPPSSSSREWNVVLVILESMHSRHLSLFGGEDNTQPLLSAYAERMHLFPNFYSVFPNSNHARFAVLGGLYPPRQYITHLNPRIPCPSLSEILHDAGWTTAMFYASTRHYTRQWDYWQHRKWDIFNDSENMPHGDSYPRVSWGVAEEAVLDAMKDQLAEYARTGERFFLTYIPASPHRPFDGTGEQFKQFDEGFPNIDRNYLGRYKNQLLRMDWILAGLVGELEARGLLEKTVVVITNDHGEFVGEDGRRIGHGWSLEPDHCRIPLIIMRPDQPEGRTVDTLGSQVDVLPTLLDILDLPLPPGKLYQGVSLYAQRDSTAPPRTVYLLAHQQRALIRDNVYMIESESGGRHWQAMRIALNNRDAEFPEIPPAESPVSPDTARDLLDRFERFQQSLIRYYHTY